ncbi:LacI family DNA-binding transcriptional regulator [Caproiciproducens sp. CPB-2]|uniref:LacI family DNA-binding transcriptional regulator n=1 Tax=unclassified Caproiciproducens TaxID=2643836 RepID=UPI0023DB1960|nr:LacI family DNA-binding transcriptional regulator [Caproiciproducens sp. CPB-2]MDF1495797.1 LacI family DNA-binding transcriptional regulator [Caproiciproducens sp. CPB-2]
MATIKDIAEKLGIAVSTVSKGLNGANDISEEMRQLVLDTAVEMGYASKKVQKLGKRKVCILVENMEYENIDQFGYEIVVGFKLSAARHHCDVTVIPTNLNMQTQEKYDSYMLKHGYSGSFLLGFALHDDYINQLYKTSVPTVLLDNCIPNKHVGYVGTDGYNGIDLAVRHLYEYGHKNIALLNGSKNSLVTNERHQAFIQSMEHYSLKVNPNLIANGYYVPECAKDYVGSFMKNGATAIVCASDLIAAGVIAELNRLGKCVPLDMSVIGFDDLPIAQHLTPTLTTVRQDRVAIGKSAFMMLEELIGGVSISKVLLKPELIIRNSTGTCP